MCRKWCSHWTEKRFSYSHNLAVRRLHYTTPKPLQQTLYDHTNIFYLLPIYLSTDNFNWLNILKAWHIRLLIFKLWTTYSKGHWNIILSVSSACLILKILIYKNYNDVFIAAICTSYRLRFRLNPYQIMWTEQYRFKNNKYFFILWRSKSIKIKTLT